jgi:hypothetical protein
VYFVRRAALEFEIRRMKMAVFEVVAPCSLVEFTDITDHPDDGGNSHLYNVGELPDYTVQQTRRQPS